jgi:hypothetical protein
MLTCNECEQHISEYLDDRLAEMYASAMHAHCSECAKCRSFLDALLRMSLVSRRVGRIEVPAALDARVRSAIAVSGKGTRQQLLFTLTRKRISIPIPIAAVLAIFVLTIGVYSWVGPRDRIQASKAPRQVVTQVMSLPTITIENE